MYHDNIIITCILKTFTFETIYYLYVYLTIVIYKKLSFLTYFEPIGGFNF